MSTIVAVRKNGMVAIAADTLTKWGSTKESSRYVVNHEKIIKVRDCYIAIAGPTSGKVILLDYFAKSKVRLDSVESIYNTWLALHAELKEKHFMNAVEDSSDSFETTRMDVLIANRHGIFGVGSYRTVQEFSRFYAYGQGGEYAMGSMFATYDDPDKSAEDLARLGIEAAAEFDHSTGLPMTVYSLKQTKQ
ncbi:MAG TPA: hypothetical protein VK445_12520 [Dissulfurispiraceae bacterium]|nr:hypothetical protein [Dissulfurispiraceae bacterium]